jgi:tetratricopeptide (TPR) repeat protein
MICLDLSEAIEVDARSQALRQDIERREAEREAELAAQAAAEEARERARLVEKTRRLREQRIEKAEALATAGNYAAASTEVDKVLAEEPDNAQALALRIGLDQVLDVQNRVLGELAASLYADGDLDAAIQVWETLLVISPDHAEARERLDRAKRVRDNLDQVREQQPGLGGEGDVIQISPVRGSGAEDPPSPGNQGAEPP